MAFPLLEMYRELVKPLIGKKLNDMPFGPFFVVVHTKDGEIEHCEVFPPFAMQYLFATDEGPKFRQKLIDSALESYDESYCVMLCYDAYVKLVKADISPDQEEALTHHRLQHDPEAKRVISFAVFHRTGKLQGFLPLSEDLVIGYDEPIEAVRIHQVKKGTDGASATKH